MASRKNSYLIINGGSSSIKFAVYQQDDCLMKILSGSIENIGSDKAKFYFENEVKEEKNELDIKAANHDEAAENLVEFISKEKMLSSITAIGHRIVHGMQHTKPEEITPQLLDELKKISAYDPEHLPSEIKLVEIFIKKYPQAKQVACFDTSFHSSMPIVAKLLSLPRKFYDKGIQRYGFHGLSYTYLLTEIKKLVGDEKANGKIVMAHLGNGASLAAIKHGKSIDTSMGFTSTSGIPMSTRTGDLDPGVAWYFMKEEKLSAAQFSHLINHESGLIGISETSSDMRELIKLKSTDIRAAEAFELFCYQAKKWIGAFAAALEGLEILVFSGGIGENSFEVRSQICKGLKYVGIQIDEDKNEKNELIISSKKSKVLVYVIKTNEELTIAKLVTETLKNLQEK